MSAGGHTWGLDGVTFDDVADGLAIAYVRLARAAAANQHLAICDLNYLGRHSQDVASAVHQAISDIDSVARLNNLAARHQVWRQAADAAVIAAADVHVTCFAMSLADTVDLLMTHLGAALEVLLNVSLHTSDDTVGHAVRAICTTLETLATSEVLDISDVWTAAG